MRILQSSCLGPSTRPLEQKLPAYEYSSALNPRAPFGAISYATVVQFRDFDSYPAGGVGYLTYPYLRLAFDSALTNAGGTINLRLGGQLGSYECFDCSPFRLANAGTVTGEVSQVPEPDSLVLLGLGLFGLAASQSRRKNSK